MSASPTSVASGSPATITWNAPGLSSCSSIDFYVPKGTSTSGTAIVYPTKTTTYWLSCVRSTGVEEKSVTVTVSGSGSGGGPGITPPLENCAPGQLFSGTTGLPCPVVPPPVNPPPLPPLPPPPSGSVTVDLKVNNSDGPLDLTFDTLASVTWTAQPLTSSTLSCTGSGGLATWSGGKPLTGLAIFKITNASIFTITCVDSLNNDSATDSVYVTAKYSTIKFQIGEQAWALAMHLNTRATPSISGTVAGWHQHGDPGVVTGVSVQADGYVWWPVDFIAGADGWVAENYLAGKEAGGIPASVAITGITDGATVSGTLNINVGLTGDVCESGSSGQQFSSLSMSKCKMNSFGASFFSPDGVPASLSFQNQSQISIDTSQMRDGWHQFSVYPGMVYADGTTLGMCHDCFIPRPIHVKTNNNSSGPWLTPEPWVKLISSLGVASATPGSTFVAEAQGGTSTGQSASILFYRPGQQAPVRVPISNGKATFNFTLTSNTTVCAYTDVGGFTSNFDCGFILVEP